MERIVRTVVRASRGRKAAVAQTRRAWSTARQERGGYRGCAHPAPELASPLRWREVMPPHPSPNVTFEQAVQAWLRVEEQERERRRLQRAARRRAAAAREMDARPEP